METPSNSQFALAQKAYTEGSVFTAFDLETTGLDPRLDQIVEIGAVKFDRKGLIARFSALVNPGIAMPEEAGAVNNITDEMLRGKPPLDEILPDFLLFIKNTVLAAHNAPFDCGFINEKLRIRWERTAQTAVSGAKAWVPPYPVLPNPIADTLLFSRENFPRLRSYSLQSLARELGIPPRDAHRAEDDARLCMEIFIRCMDIRK